MTKDLTIADIYGFRSDVDGEIGIEVEVEGFGLPTGGFTNWRVERDGSLRNESAEYVSTVLPRRSVRTALVELADTFRLKGASITDSIRAGTHIHVNVRDLTPVQLLTYLTAYYMVEDLLCDSAGNGRAGNMFCLRLSDTYETVDYIRDFTRGDFRSFNRQDMRYNAANLAAVGKFGSLEFRQLRTPTNLMSIHPWVIVFTDIKDTSIRLFNNPRDVVEAVSANEEGFVRQILGPIGYDLVSPSLSAINNSVINAARTAQDYVFATDWREVNERFKPYTKKNSILDWVPRDEAPEDEDLNEDDFEPPPEFDDEDEEENR